MKTHPTISQHNTKIQASAQRIITQGPTSEGTILMDDIHVCYNYIIMTV